MIDDLADIPPHDVRARLAAMATDLGYVEPEVQVESRPADLPGFPDGIPVEVVTFQDWSLRITIEGAHIARLRDAEDAVEVCNWAARSGWVVRPSGANHNWTPLIYGANATMPGQVLLVDTSALNGVAQNDPDQPTRITFGTGITLEEASARLTEFDNGGTGAAPGFAFPQLPAPGHLTLGGALAVGAHGTVVPTTNDPDNRFMGCLSNLVTGFQAVVTDPNGDGSYSLQTFDRGTAAAGAFLVHLGRAFITEVTLVVEPNAYFQLRCLFPSFDELFGTTASDQQFSSMLDEYGRIEVLWFPFNDEAFVQANRRMTERIEPQVSGPYNYPWMNTVDAATNQKLTHTLKATPAFTPAFTKGELAMAKANESGITLNGQSRDLEIYLEDTTLRVTLWGWVLQIPRQAVQAVANTFATKVRDMIAEAEARGVYPINAAMEIRCTAVDGTDGSATTPTLAATNPAVPSDPSIDTVIWLNVGTATGTPGSDEFFTELEAWLIEAFGTPRRTLRPEWSKAWAYTSDGPWTNAATIELIRNSFPGQDKDDFADAAATLAAHDRSGLFRSPLLGTLFQL